MTNMTRRAFATAGGVGLALCAGAAGKTAGAQAPAPVGPPLDVADRAALRALTGAGGLALVRGADAGGLGGGLFAFDAADRTSRDDGGIVLVDASGGRWKRIFEGPVCAEWFGAAGLADAAAAAGAFSSDLMLGPQTFAVSADLELAGGRTYKFAPGAKIQVASGKTLTIRGALEAPSVPIFSGDGKVAGIRSVVPEWWGAVGDGKGDHAPALQAALDCVAASEGSDGDLQCVRLSGNYQIGSTLNAIVSAGVNLRISGGGTIFGGARLTAAAAFRGDIALHVRGQAEGDLSSIADWGFSDFAVVGAPGTTCKVGIKIGEGERSLIGLQKSRIQGVHAGGFAVCWLVTNVRLIKFENCSGWADSVPGGVAMSVTLESVDFTGDIEFDSCQFVAPQDTGRAVLISHASAFDRGSGGGQLKGVYFSNCAFYKGEFFVEIYAASGAVMGDIWLDKCQFDGFGKTQLRVGAEGKGSIENVRVTNCYFRGVNEGFFAILADIAKTGAMRSLHLSDNWIANCLSRAVLLRGVQNLVFDQNSFVECADGESVVHIETGSSWQANHNTLVRVANAKAPHFLTLHDSCAPRGIAVGNTADPGAVSRSIVDDRRTGYSLPLARDVAVVDGQVGIGTEKPGFPLHVVGAMAIAPGASVEPQAPGEIVFELTADSKITLKAKGGDGVVRRVTLDLA